jgi:hypothetical protein
VSDLYRSFLDQGATCYLNSLIQTLYLTPEFKASLFNWFYDKSKGIAFVFAPSLSMPTVPIMLNITSKSTNFLSGIIIGFLDGPEAASIPYQLQLLFGRLSQGAAAVVPTKDLTQSFGWNHADAVCIPCSLYRGYRIRILYGLV